MRIAQVAPLAERVPPKRYGGTERVVYALTEELVKRGHDVTLFASGDSQTSAKLESVYPRALREAKLKDIYGTNDLTMLHLGLAYELQDEFDIIHDHLAPMSLPTANLASTPVVVTMHGPFTSENRRLFEMLRTPHIVTASQAQLYPLPNINHAGTVHHGLPMRDYPFSDTHEGYLLYVGRISIEKGVHYAVDVAQVLDLPLILAAKVEQSDLPYFREYIEPLRRRLLSRDLFVPQAGIHTLSNRSRHYDALSYHNGSIWPHDTAMLAEGLENFGYHDDAARVRGALLRAYAHFQTPIELFGWQRGFKEFKHSSGAGACRLQAWSAAGLLAILSTHK